MAGMGVGASSRSEDMVQWAGGPSFQLDLESLPKMFQQGVLRLKKASGLLLQGKGCKLRHLQGQENGTRVELAGERDRLI